MSSRESPGSDREPAAYEQRGVSASKHEVKAALRGIDPGLFPGAFCKAVPDRLTGSEEHCVLVHADGAGTKSALAYLDYAVHGDPAVFRGIAQDSLVMNIDDLICVGATGPYVFSNTIGRNSKLIPGAVLQAIIGGYEDLCEAWRPLGIEIHGCGGETADVGDLARTLIVDSTVCVRMRRSDFIDCSQVRAGHVIVGLASFGRATYEASENSGVGTNGFTALRHGLFSGRFRDKYPETFAPQIEHLAYTGIHGLDDPLPGTSLTLGQACLSPTRTYAPVMIEVFKRLRPSISAVFHNTGGGQTKCLNFGSSVAYVKDNLFPLPPLFEFIRRETGIPMRDMFRVFNMGHRLEVVCDPDAAAEVIAIAEGFGIQARVVGRVEPAQQRSLEIHALGEVHRFEPHP